MNPSLLDQAKSYKSPTKLRVRTDKFTNEDVDLSIAVLKGEVALKSMLAIKQLPQAVSGYVYIFSAIRFGVLSGYLTLKTGNN